METIKPSVPLHTISLDSTTGSVGARTMVDIAPPTQIPDAQPKAIDFVQFETSYVNAFRNRSSTELNVASLRAAGVVSAGGINSTVDLTRGDGACFSLNPPIGGGHVRKVIHPHFLTAHQNNEVSLSKISRKTRDVPPGYTGVIPSRATVAVEQEPLRSHIPGYSGHVVGKNHAIGSTLGDVSRNAFFHRGVKVPETFKSRQLKYIISSFNPGHDHLTAAQLREFFIAIGESQSSTNANVDYLLSHTLKGSEKIVTVPEITQWLVDLTDQQPEYLTRLVYLFKIQKKPVSASASVDPVQLSASQRVQFLENVLSSYKSADDGDKEVDDVSYIQELIKTIAGSTAEYNLMAKILMSALENKKTELVWSEMTRFMQEACNQDMDRWKRFFNAYAVPLADDEKTSE